MDAMVYTPATQEHHERLKKVIEGRPVLFAKPKNAFKEPDAPGAVFPQHEVIKPIDFRATNLPMAGFAFKGGRRKYEGDQAAEMHDLAKSSHPKMEVLAGGGAICAKTGQRLTKEEAAIQALAVDNPAAAALQMSAPISAASAVAAAVDDDMDDESDNAAANDDTGKNEADHARRPIKKKQTKEARPRSNAVMKKSNPVKVGAAKAGKKKA